MNIKMLKTLFDDMNIKLLKRLRDKKKLKLLDVLSEQYKEDDEVCFYDLALLIADGYITTDFYYQSLITKGQKLQKIEAVPICGTLYQDYKNYKINPNNYTRDEYDPIQPSVASILFKSLYYTGKADEYLKEHATKNRNRWSFRIAVVATVVAIASFLDK